MNGRWSKHFLRDKAGDGGDGGSGGSGDLLGGGTGGGANPSGGANSGSGGAAGDQTAAGGTGNPGQEGSAPPDWRASLPPELQENSQLKRYKSATDLAAGYVNLQKQFSGKKLAIPGANASEEDWAQVFTELGVPKEVKDYQVKFGEGATIDEKFVEEYKTLAHKAGILPKQAQALADWFSEKNKGAEETYANEIKASREKALGELKTKWGAAYNQKLSAANALFKEAPPEMQQALKDSGLAASTVVTELLATLADKYLSEDKILDAGQSGVRKFSPVEAKKAADMIMADNKHPYHQKDHPGHKAAVKEVADLFNMMHPGS